ncbi:MAG TPA: Nif3-like dinuclear metal center hexameric protein [Pyrinomonadaceae bacterium]|nr:Nif3-like dinuclear metal center hexameric protein [Pyrinomonadaceae bacterium]
MKQTGLSRRRFCQLTGSGLLLSPLFMRAQSKSGSSLTAREVVARIKKNVGVPWHTPTADEFKVGDPDVPISGITTTFMSTLDLLERSMAAGNNFVITHEPTFWSAADVVSDLRDDPLYEFKLNFIEKNKMVVWRFHDHWHAHRPDGIFTGWNKTMGWESYASPAANPFSHEYVIPETSLEELARDMQTKLKTRSMRLVGDPKLRVTKLAHAGHYIQQCMQALQKVDVLMVFECREWEAAEYVRDAIASGQKKALIQLPHEGGEEAGMDECARWLRTFVSEVPIKFIPSGDPFWMPA